MVHRSQTRYVAKRGLFSYVFFHFKSLDRNLREILQGAYKWSFFGLDSVSQNFTFSLLMQQHFYTFIRASFSANDCGRFYGTLISYLLVIVQMGEVRIDIAYMVLWYCIFTEFESRMFMIEINRVKFLWKTNFLWPFILSIILQMAE